jgi:uncharacterized protein with PIN domain
MNGNRSADEMRFVIDHNVGKLARWLRMLGFDSLFFNGEDDGDMVRQALAEGRIILTRDTGVMKRRVITQGRLKAILIESEEPEKQIRQLMAELDIKERSRPFTLCLECNKSLVPRTPDEVRERVPPYVFKTQKQYVECPACRRVYWRGTHFSAMLRKVERFMG